MKLENLVFQNKKHTGFSAVNKSYPNVRVSKISGGRGAYRTRIAFRCCDTLYSSNTHVTYAIAGNRLYFMFCGDSRQAYKISNLNKSIPILIIQYNKEISKFIRNDEYTPKLDNECGLWYIEY